MGTTESKSDAHVQVSDSSTDKVTQKEHQANCHSIVNKITAKKQKIVHGYVRNNFMSSIPMELIQIIIMFYDYFYNWKFGRQQVQTLIAGDVHEFISDSIQLGEIKICYELKLTKYSDTNYISYGVRCDELPDHIQNVGICIQFQCEQTNPVFQGDGGCKIGYDSMESLKKGSNFHKSSNLYFLQRNLMHKLSDFDGEAKEIYIDCCAEIKYIQYRSSAKSDYNILPIFKTH